MVEWNRTNAPYPGDRCIHELFEEHVGRTPGAIAVEHDGLSLSYVKLNEQANRLAHHLRERGVGPDARVAICMDRSLLMLVAVVGVWKAGGAYVPLDPGYPPERLHYLLSDSEPVLLLTDAVGRAALGESLTVPVIDVQSEAARLASYSGENTIGTEPGLRSHHLANVIYTSGSTGEPKAVMIEHRGLCNLATALIAACKVDESSSVLQFASMSFDMCALDIVMALCSGAKLYLPASGQMVMRDSLQEVLRQGGITHAVLPTGVLEAVKDVSRAREVAQRSRRRRCLYSGDRRALGERAQILQWVWPDGRDGLSDLVSLRSQRGTCSCNRPADREHA